MDLWSSATFSQRLLLLLALLVAVSGVELWLRGRRATRWRDSLTLLVVGAIGSCFGAAVDSVTVRISPAYFELGKGLGEGEGLPWRASALGLEAGFGGGLLIACVLVYFNRLSRALPSLSARRLLALLRHPALGAVLGALLLGLLPWLVFAGFAGDPSEFLGEEEARAFLRVRQIHLGVYLGAAAGLVHAARQLQRLRREGARAPA